MRKRLLPLLLAVLLLAGCARPAPDSAYSLTLWLVEGDPLAPALHVLAEIYNATRGRDTLPLSLRLFESEERLLAALHSGAAPALALLRRETALSLAESGLLVDPGLSPVYPSWLSGYDGLIGHGYYPVGFSLPLLCCAESAPASLSALLEESARRGRAGESACLYIGSYAPVFRQGLLDSGEDIAAAFTQRSQNRSYVNLYNLVADAVFDGGLSLSPGGVYPWRIESGSALRAQNLTGKTLRPLSDGALCAACSGLAVTVRESRMRRALPDLLRWLFDAQRLPAAALDAGLIPASPLSRAPADALDEALLALVDRPLVLDGGAAETPEDFDAALREALALLPPGRMNP